MDMHKHGAEIRQRLRQFQYEPTADGRILLRGGTNVVLGGAFAHREYRGGEAGPREIDPNLVTNEGLNYLLNAAFFGQAQLSDFYIALFKGNVAPAAGWTGATFNASATEFTDYVDAARPAWAIGEGPTADQTAGNTGSEALFVYAAGGPYNLYGAALLSGSGKANGLDKLIAATKFAVPRLNQLAGDKLGVEYVFTAVDAG